MPVFAFSMLSIIIRQQWSALTRLVLTRVQPIHIRRARQEKPKVADKASGLSQSGQDIVLERPIQWN